jgi:flagellar protein FlgJ
MTLPVESAAVYTDTKGLAALKSDARAHDPQALRAAARQFESLFASMMLKSARAASFGDSLMGSDQTQFYQGMFDDQMAVEMTKGKGLGLADMLVQQLTRAGLVPPGTDTTQSPDAPALKPKSLLNPLAGPTSTTPSKALAILGTLSTLSNDDPTMDLSHVQTSSLDTISAKIDAALKAAESESSTSASNADSKWPAATPEDFVRQLWPVAQQAGRELGVDPKHILAQAALETGWGRSVPTDTEGRPTNNFFGIKAGSQWSGTSVSLRTLEFENGIPVPRRERFRAYASVEEGFKDYVALLRDNPRYADAINTGSDSKAFASGLQKAGYATDPAYAHKIASIAQNLNSTVPTLKSGDERPMTPTPSPL